MQTIPDDGVLAGLLLGLIMLGIIIIYFLPTVIAWKKTVFTTVFVVNLLFGWSIIGWIIALIIAVGEEIKCPYCRGKVEKKAVKCKNCGSDLP